MDRKDRTEIEHFVMTLIMMIGAMAVLAIFLTGCTSTGDPKTIAAGAEGKVDYCIDLAIIEPICINASRTLGKDE